MTRPSDPPILSELRSASSPASQVAALRALKNEVIGHEQKKQMWVGLGVLAPIARILNTHKGNGKRRHRDVNNSTNQSKQRGGRSDEEEARLQAIIIVGSLANGGPAYVSPIFAGLIISPLLALLSPAESSPHLVLNALRSLNAVADSLFLSHSDHDASEDGLVNLLYTEQHLPTIANLLLQASPLLVAQQQIALTAALISKTCRDDHHRAMLAQTGVLEALAVRLASFVVATGCALNPSSGGSKHVGDVAPATSRSRISPILQAIGAIIQNSKPRAIQFLNSPAFACVFQKPEADGTSSYEKKPAVWGPNASNMFNVRQAPPNAIDILIPPLPSTHFRSSLAPNSTFPPLGALGSSSKPTPMSRSFSSAIEVIQSQGLEFIEEEESSLIAWLLYIARIEHEVTGLMAAWVLAILYRHGLTKRGREAAFALLLVPSLVRLLDKDSKTSSDASNTYDTSVLASPDRLIKEHAPSVLAMLAANSLEIQKAAADAGAIKKLSQLLKESYDEMPATSSTAMWTPESSTSRHPEGRDDASKLGPAGVSATAYHVMRLRESVLIALAAIASDKDEYRRAIIDNGVIPFVVKTLKPEESDPVAQPNGQTEETSRYRRAFTGNCRDAILAACGAAKALSRSVSTLRTSLMDAGLPAPLFVLIKCKDIELQIAATAVVTNLVLHFSPMREAIIEAGALKILCEHAHSMNAILRLNSVWALKHVVLDAPNVIKMSCLEELGPGWLKQIVNNDVDTSNHATMSRSGDREDGSSTPIRMSTPNAAGEQVDLLNAVEEDSRESSQDIEDDGEEDLKMADSIGALSRAELDRKLYSHSRNGRGPILEPTSVIGRRRSSQPALTDELAIQQQGLDFIRNLICGSGASDMIEHIFRELGQDKVFEMLAAKLRPRVFNAFNRERRSSENGVRHVQPQTDIIVSVCYIVVHIAAGSTRQRQLLISQTELLKLIVPLFSHPSKDVRACCLWIVINLTWIDDASDNMNCKARARELMKLGVYEKLEHMEHDADLDCRERARTAGTQMSTLLRL